MKSTDLSFEQAMEKLELIVKELEEGSLGLDKSLDQFEAGMTLAKECEGMLNAATGRVEKILKDFSGNQKIVELDGEDL